MMNKWEVAWLCPLLWTGFWGEKKWNPEKMHPSSPYAELWRANGAAFITHTQTTSKAVGQNHSSVSGRVRQALSNPLSRYYEPESEVKRSAKNKTIWEKEANKLEWTGKEDEEDRERERERGRETGRCVNNSKRQEAKGKSRKDEAANRTIADRQLKRGGERRDQKPGGGKQPNPG